jgi:hypothetical protein
MVFILSKTAGYLLLPSNLPIALNGRTACVAVIAKLARGLSA